MSIDTFSLFFFGHETTSENLNFPFDEGAGEINAEIPIGSYSLSEYVIELQSALNAASVTRIFSVSVDRSTRLITISADGPFDILLGTGTTRGSSAFLLTGFTGSSDLTGLSSYTGDSGTGKAYENQFILQDYIDKENFVESNEASVNTSASGRIETVRFGLNKFYRMNFRFITNEVTDNKVIKNNQSGVQDAQEFLREITKRTRFEYMPDIDQPDVFDRVILEEIPGNSTATGFQLRELYNQGLPGYFDTGALTLRVVD